MTGSRPDLRRAVLLLGVLLGMALPAPVRASSDPLEAVNRHVHGFNLMVRTRVLSPMAEAYRAATRPETRRGVARVLANLGEPVSAISGLAAWDLDRAWNATARFGINTTLGLGGVQDRAAEMGYPPRPMPLADAVCSWGMPSGPFLVLPLLGPSTLRDAGALVATSVALSQVIPPELVTAWGAGDAFATYADWHAEIARMDSESLDSYAAYRSAYLQRRAMACATDRARLAEAEELEMAAAVP